MSKVRHFSDYADVLANPESLREGGGPPYDGGMEARVIKLEEFAQETRDRLTRIEMRLEATSTKTDLSESIGGLRSELYKAMNEQTWKLIGAMITFGGLVSAAVFFIARNVR